MDRDDLILRAAETAQAGNKLMLGIEDDHDQPDWLRDRASTLAERFEELQGELNDLWCETGGDDPPAGQEGGHRRPRKDSTMRIPLEAEGEAGRE